VAGPVDIVSHTNRYSGHQLSQVTRNVSLQHTQIGSTAIESWEDEGGAVTQEAVMEALHTIAAGDEDSDSSRGHIKAKAIGAASARMLAREGAKVVITDIKDSEGEAVAAISGRRWWKTTSANTAMSPKAGRPSMPCIRSAMSASPTILPMASSTLPPMIEIRTGSNVIDGGCSAINSPRCSGFRPMFLTAGSWAAISLALWLAMFFGHLSLPTRFDPMSWHIHEMLFGFVMAAVAGFL
jgi:hypothetical protein